MNRTLHFVAFLTLCGAVMVASGCRKPPPSPLDQAEARFLAERAKGNSAMDAYRYREAADHYRADPARRSDARRCSKPRRNDGEYRRRMCFGV